TYNHHLMRRQRGFSLIEVMVGILILGVVITTSLAVFVERKKRLQQASEIILAYQVLANEAEMQRRKDFSSVTNGPFDSDTSLLNPLGPYTALVKVDPRGPHSKNVTMTIRWRNGQKEAKLALIRVLTGGETFW
ncbi:MAG TPA: type II secretion system protein, partial [Thermoanaerobaculia bacterium]|nr:type II secretion system protein [Thermoanaerobaculia bacterium]